MKRLITTDYETALSLVAELAENKKGYLPISDPTDNRRYINLDIAKHKRTRFISPTGNLVLFQSRWLMTADQENYHYQQGDATGGAISVYFFLDAQENGLTYSKLSQNPNELRALFKQGDLSDQHKQFRFGYFNDLGEVCGISINYNSENPQQWIITILQNANTPYQQRRIYTFINEMEFTSSLSSYQSTVEEFLACLGSFSIAQLLEPLIDKNTYAINENFSTLLLDEKGLVNPSKCAKPKDLIALYQNKIGEHLVERKKTVSIQASEEEEPDVFEVNLDEPLNYDDILKFKEARFRVLIPWLQEKGFISEDCEMPTTVFPETSICPFSEDTMPNSLSNFLTHGILSNKAYADKECIALIPLDYGSHWNLLVICINPNKHIISADYFYSYPNEAPERLDEQSILSREIKRAQPDFRSKIFCFHHFHSNNPNSSGVLAIEEMVFYIKYRLGIEKKLDPLYFKEDDIATLLAQYKRLLRLDPSLQQELEDPNEDERNPSSTALGRR